MVGAVCIMSGFGQYPASQHAVVGLNLANSTQSFSHVGCVHDQKEEHLVLHSWCATYGKIFVDMSQLTREAAAACTEIRRRMMSDIFVEVVMSDEPKKKYQLRILKFSPDLS